MDIDDTWIYDNPPLVIDTSIYIYVYLYSYCIFEASQLWGTTLYLSISTLQSFTGLRGGVDLWQHHQTHALWQAGRQAGSGLHRDDQLACHWWHLVDVSRELLMVFEPRCFGKPWICSMLKRYQTNHLFELPWKPHGSNYAIDLAGCFAPSRPSHGGGRCVSAAGLLQHQQ